MPDSISFDKLRKNQKRGQWRQIELAPFGTTLKSDSDIRNWAKTKIVGRAGLPIVYPKGGLERAATAKEIKNIRRRAGEIPME
ncbi:MAG: hypothetical protein AAB573_03810 [Patescibacteria group bacterium]